MMSKILITGATGFIGSWLVKHFMDKNYQIIAHGSSKESINKLKIKLQKSNIKFKNIEFWEQDFLKEIWNFPMLSEKDAIIHCAGATKIREGNFENYDRYFILNILATKKLAKKALEVNISHFIHLSTGQVFGGSLLLFLSQKIHLKIP
ncbi:MAG: NAD-dependent epimerase/dehydratase family protein [Promethearchaeota archaeon]